MRPTTRFLVTAASFAVVAACAACGSSGSSTSSSSGSNSETAHIRVGFVNGPISNPYFGAMEQGAKAAAKKYGATLTVASPSTSTDESQQANDFNAMISAGNDCYAFDPESSLNLVAPLARASKQGIPLIELSEPPATAVNKPRGIKITSFVGSDNYTTGQAAGRLMLQLVPAGSDVSIIGGVAGVQGTNDRPDGFRAVVKGKLNVTQFIYVAATDEPTALSDAAEMIRGNPSLNAIFTIGGEQALGAQIAVNNAKKDIKVVGIDGILPQLKEIAAGTMAGGVSQFPYLMGYQGVEACIAAHAKKTLPARVITPTLGVTHANAAAAVASYPAPPASLKVPDPFATLLQQLGING